MATDYFLKIDGISGESLDSKHKGEIELQSFSWGDTLETAPSPAGGGAGKAHIKDFQFMTKMSKASPLLFLASVSGQHIKSAVVTGRKPGAMMLEYLTIKFTDVLISSYESDVSAPDQLLPLEQVSFNFGQIVVSYRPQKPDGTLDAPIQAGWDAKANKRV